MKALIFIANGTEDTEFIETRDLLLRSKMEVVTASIENRRAVKLSHSIYVLADKIIDKLEDADSYDVIIIPGGKLGVSKMKESEKLIAIIKKQFESGKLVAAICAAPTVLSKAGVLKGLEYTVYDGFETEIKSGKYNPLGVIKSKNVITAKSMNYTMDFSFEIIRTLLGDEAVEKVEKGILKVN